jgi:hypothetical protein
MRRKESTFTLDIPCLCHNKDNRKSRISADDIDITIKRLHRALLETSISLAYGIVTIVP